MSNRSRLSKRLEDKTKQSIAISIFGIVIVLGLLAKFGIPFIINATLFISGTKSNDTSVDKSKTADFISAPVLDALPTATNSATITISGTAFSKQVIKLYVNGSLEDKTEAKSDKTFTFPDVALEKGENLIQAKATLEKENKESDFSSSYTVIYKKDPPTLAIDSPSDNQSFSKDDKFAAVKGKTDSGTKVTVNNLWAIVDDSGNFSYNFPLQNGDNHIKIKATDQAGNTTEKEIKVTYSQ